MNKILISIGYAFFAIVEVALLIYSSRPKTSKPRPPEEFTRDSANGYALYQACSAWILWQAFLDIVSLWNG